MKSKFIIFLVFASLVQSSYVPTLTITSRLSKQQVTVLNKIIIDQEKVAEIYFKRFKVIFRTFYDLKAATENDYFKLLEALIGVKVAINLAYESILTAAGGSCPAVEADRKVSDNYLKDAATRVPSAFKLAQSSNYYRDRAAMNIHRAAFADDFTNIVKLSYASIFSCLHLENVHMLPMIRPMSNGSLLVHTSNAVFNAIKLWGATVSSGCSYGTFASDIQEFEDKALSALRDEIDYTFSLIKTHVIYSGLNRRKVISKLFPIQYALTKSYNKYEAVNEISFGTVRRYLRKIYLGLGDDGELDFSRIDLDTAAAIALYNDADASVLESIRVLHPESSAAITAASERIFRANTAGVIVHFNLIRAAAEPRANYSKIIDDIENLRKVVVALAPGHIGEWFKIIRNNQTFDGQDDAELTTLEQRTVDAAVFTDHKFLDAVQILAKAAHGGEVSENDFIATRTLQEESDSGAALYAQGIFSACLLVLAAENTN